MSFFLLYRIAWFFVAYQNLKSLTRGGALLNPLTYPYQIHTPHANDSALLNEREQYGLSGRSVRLSHLIFIMAHEKP